MKSFAGMVTSDWSECLAPCGPFDMFTFHYPHLVPGMEEVFRGYTSNAITLTEAAARINRLLPASIDAAQVDVYLAHAFEIYADVAALMSWCRRNDILLMINSTGAIGYFQRVFAKGLVAPPDALAAHPMVRFEAASTDPEIILPIREIGDKPVHSAAVAQRFGIAAERIVVIGDSGGDGPHFEWGAEIGATLVASLAKPSLLNYCGRRNIEIHHHWNPGLSMAAEEGGGDSGRCNLDNLIEVIRGIVR